VRWIDVSHEIVVNRRRDLPRFPSLLNATRDA
jgi:hypothetical protein